MDALIAERRARRIRSEVQGGYTQERVIALDEPAPIFTALELSFADEMLRDLARYNARELSDLAHRQFVGWRLVGSKERIPYETHYVSPLAATPSEIRRGQALYAEATQGA